MLLTSCYTLARCMIKRGMATNPVPDPPSLQERKRIEGYFESCDGPPGDNAGSRIPQRKITAIKGNSKIDTDYVQYIHATMRRWGISRFTMDWDQHWYNQFNQILCHFFIRVWKWGLAYNCFGLIAQKEAAQINMEDHTLMAIYWRHAKSLKCYYKRGKKGQQTLAEDQEKNTQLQSLKHKSIGRQLYLQEQGIHPRFIEIFDDKFINSDDEMTYKDNVEIAAPKNPVWCSARATEFIDWIEKKRRNQKEEAGGSQDRRKLPNPSWLTNRLLR
ncbi:hypothetical protein VP01_5710g1 [Puccinia sorghi]|uniref:Uncharacterized protein n=1 Tax=Puccinia sorghi TaxID=27349 RepID=A0A0L6UIP7_9BASI|nr:hypothetical protein VP01_5710g1 [Puccinia sorghi]